MCTWSFATGFCSFVVGSHRSIVDAYVSTCKERWEKGPIEGQEEDICKRLFGISTIARKTREPRTAFNDALPHEEIGQTDEVILSFLSSLMGDFNRMDSGKAKGVLSTLRVLKGKLSKDLGGLLKKCFDQLGEAEKQNPVGVLRLIALVLTSYKNMDSGLVDYLLKICSPVDISKDSARKNVDKLFKFISAHEDFFKQKVVIDSISAVISSCFEEADRAAGCQEFSFLCYMQALCEYFYDELDGLIPNELLEFDKLMGTLLGLSPLGINVGYQSSPFADSQKGANFYTYFAPRTIQLLIPLLQSWKNRHIDQEFGSYLAVDSSAHDLCRILFYFGLVRNVIELFGRNATISPYGVITTNIYTEQDWTTNPPDPVRLLFFLSNGCSLSDSIDFAKNAVTHCVGSWDKFLEPLTLALKQTDPDSLLHYLSAFVYNYSNMAVFKRGQSSIMEWICHATSNVCECRWVFKYQDNRRLILNNIVNTFPIIQSFLTEKKGSDLSAIIDWLIERIKKHPVQYEIRKDEQQFRSSLQRFLTHLDVVALNYSQIGSWELQNRPPDNFLKLVQSLVECTGMENPVVETIGSTGS